MNDHEYLRWNADEGQLLTEKENIEQRLSSMVRARLLFRREVAIYFGGANLMNSDFFEKIIAQKAAIDGKMAKIIFSSAVTTFLLYLASAGVNPTSQFFGLRASEIPSILIVLSLVSSYGVALSAYTFMNSQVYAALIDQIVLQVTQDGLLDPDIYKSAFSEEWLIFKVIRRDFSFFVDPHIDMNSLGRTLNSTVFVLMVLVAMAPFIVLLFSQPYLTWTVLDNSWPSMLAKAFSTLSAFSAVGLVVITQLEFKCTVELQDKLADDDEDSATL